MEVQVSIDGAYVLPGSKIVYILKEPSVYEILNKILVKLVSKLNQDLSERFRMLSILLVLVLLIKDFLCI